MIRARERNEVLMLVSNDSLRFDQAAMILLILQMEELQVAKLKQSENCGSTTSVA